MFFATISIVEYFVLNEDAISVRYIIYFLFSAIVFDIYIFLLLLFSALFITSLFITLLIIDKTKTDCYNMRKVMM